MNIPTGVSHLLFWEQAKTKGIKVTSRFTAVSLNINSKAPSWIARVYLKRKCIYSKRFPFTEQGEKDASNYYEAKRKTLKR